MCYRRVSLATFIHWYGPKFWDELWAKWVGWQMSNTRQRKIWELRIAKQMYYLFIFVYTPTLIGVPRWEVSWDLVKLLFIFTWWLCFWVNHPTFIDKAVGTMDFYCPDFSHRLFLTSPLSWVDFRKPHAPLLLWSAFRLLIAGICGPVLCDLTSLMIFS